VSLELISWVANELRLALLEEGESGVVKGNVHALDTLGGTTPADLFAGVQGLLGDADAEGARDALLGPAAQRS